MGCYFVTTYCVELCCLLLGERSSELLMLLSFMCFSKSPCHEIRCCGQSVVQDGVGMRIGRSCFHSNSGIGTTFCIRNGGWSGSIDNLNACAVVELLVLLSFMCFAKSPCLEIRCCGQSVPILWYRMGLV